MESTETVRNVNIINGKPSKVLCTRGFHEQYGGLEAQLYVSTAIKLLQEHPYDMLVFEQPEQGFYQVRIAGYLLDGTSVYPEEEKVVFKTKSLDIRKFWVKVDDYGEYNVITFLFPDEY